MEGFKLRIIITGDTNFKDYAYLKRKVIETLGILSKEGCFSLNGDITEITLITGKAKGAVELGKRFSKEFQSQFIRLKLKEFPTEGETLTSEMVRYAQDSPILGVLIAFWDSASKDLKHIKDLAQQYALKTFIYN